MSVSILFAHKKVTSVEDAIGHLENCGIWNFFDKRAVSFINKFSSLLLKYPGINQYPDLVALAYWHLPVQVLPVQCWAQEQWQGSFMNVPPFSQVRKQSENEKSV